MDEQHKSDLSIKSADFSVKYRGPALYSLVIMCIIGIVLVSIFATGDTYKFGAIIFLFVGMLNLINLLAATLGFTMKND
ncbi:MAG TPA: hypothetical protein DCF93_02565 [Desulfuromonas sp.]|nr:hypothetical protein [Desulfuromonas sp.]